MRRSRREFESFESKMETLRWNCERNVAHQRNAEAVRIHDKMEEYRKDVVNEQNRYN